MAKVILFGTGKGAVTALTYLQLDSEHEIVAFTIHGKYLTDTRFHGLPVVSFETLAKTYGPSTFKLFAPLGYDNMNKIRTGIFEEGKTKGYEFISYIHSSNKTLKPITVGENCFILENQSINFDVTIGNNVVMWSGNQIGDRVIIEDNVWISSHVCIAGDTVVKRNSILGINCTISHGITVAEENFIGAGALIVKSTDPSSVYVTEATPKGPFTSDRFMRLIKRA